MAASSSSAAADSRPPKYDVFISFRGETRNSFTSHLYSELRKKQINAYIDEECLEKGDDISRALPKAIEESTISIIIFSEDYASSRWCLDELVQILKCREEKDQFVLPIFYGIDPSHIRHQKRTYDDAFVKHQLRFEDKILEEWRQALTRAAGLSGWDSRDKSESALVKQVVEDVIRKLESISSISIDDLKGLVGIRRQLCEIGSLLFFDPPNVCILGIWGMGGIGKTTLARVAFNCFSNWFEGACFLENVREESKRKGLVQLKKEVFSKLLGEKDPDVDNSFVNKRLSRTKAFLVLDDVDNFDQLKCLVRDRDRFGPGSKIILTSRDLQVLNQLIDVTYKVPELDLKNEASQLFYLKAFGENSCRTGYEEISAKIASFTGGNPLALQVLGSSLKSLDVEEWENALEDLKKSPDLGIQEMLRISYDGLRPREQEIFLDIACFLKNEKKDFVEGILPESSYAITVLINKSLITVNQYGLIRMHDLIQEMGWEIVRESTEKLGKPSRLWTAKDVSDVLENNIETRAIKGIYLPWIKEEVHLRPDVFKEMYQLRLLKIYDARQNGSNSEVKVYIDRDLEYLPYELRYLHWEGYPGKSWPSNFQPNNLVELHMPCSKLEQLGDGFLTFWSLKHINLRRSLLLTKIPDLSLCPKLESINLSDCRSLIHIPSLNLRANLKDESPYIILSNCVSLTSLPEVRGNIRKLVLSGSALEELPSSIESLGNLLLLDLGSCYNLKSPPKLPRNIEVLNLSHSGWIQSKMSRRSRKLLHRFQSLASEHIRDTLCKLTRLQELSLCGSKLESFPMLLGLCDLTKLDLTDCNIREIPDWLGSLTSLTSLYLRGNIFDRIPESIGMLYKLKELDIRYCQGLQSLPELPLFMESLNARGCSSLEMVSTLRSTLTLGRWLDKYDCDSNNYQREFSFVDCAKLSEDAIRNIFREFLYKVFCTATTPPEVVVSTRVMSLQKKDVQRVIRGLVVCYPTKEIPRWFNNQSEGSSITIGLPTNWYNPTTFLGFVVSVIVVSEDLHQFHSSVECILHLRTDTERFRVNYGDYGYIFESDLDHIVMWYNYFDHSKVNFEKEYKAASFEFGSPGLKLKRCGVRMFYLKDAVEKSDDGTTANFESWRIDPINFDSDRTLQVERPPIKFVYTRRGKRFNAELTEGKEKGVLGTELAIEEREEG